MKPLYIILLVALVSVTQCFAQQMSTTTYRDLSIPYIEQDLSAYDFAYPLYSDILDSTDFTPPDEGIYLASGYGNRYASSRVEKNDNHGGLDFWSRVEYRGTVYDETNRPPLICMCDGVISNIINGTDSALELTATGRSVQVTCDSLHQSFGGNIRINYRHLTSLSYLSSIADTTPSSTVRISKGDTVGIMGESGFTSFVHLHLSVQTTHPVYGSAFVNTNRFFDPTDGPGIIRPLENAQVKLLHNWQDSAIFRVIWPFNQSINRFEFISQNDTVVFEKEAAYETGSAIRDNHDCIPRISVFAYQFNGLLTAEARYLNEMGNMPAIYPASPQRDTNLALYGYSHIPITHDSISYVYDFIVKDLSPSHNAEDFTVRLSDVWGYTVEGTFPSTTTSIEEAQRQLVKVYPNPVKDQLNLSFEDDGFKTFSLYDMNGKSVISKSFNEPKIQLDITELHSGVYILQVQTERGIESVKMVKY